jgi:predicted dehydrogenase
MKDKLGIGIIGCGGVSSGHGAAYAEFSDISEIVAVSDVIAENARRRMKEWNAKAVYDDYRNLLADDRVDAVSVCTPHYLHGPVAVDAAKAGVHVIVEKPMAINIRQATEMIESAKANNIVLSVIFQNQYSPNNKFIHRRVLPELGKIEFSYLLTYHYRDAGYYASGAWRGTWEKEGGGVFVNQAVHAWDIFQSYNGGVDYAKGFWANILHPTIEVEDIGYGLIEFKNGSFGKLFTTSCWNAQHEMVIKGERGRIIGTAGEMGDCRFELENKSLQEKLMSEFEKERQQTKYSGHRAQIRDFLEAIIESREPLVTGESASESVKIFQSIYLYGWPYASKMRQYIHENFELPQSVEKGREAGWDGRELARRMAEIVKNPEHKLGHVSNFLEN